MQQARREPPLSGKSQEPKSPQWFLISEDHSLSLRLVSGAILCEGEDGELVVSAQEASHAARFDIIEDELWLSCMTGQVRADGQLVAHHRRVESGVQLQIGITRYFVADTINETMPDIPILQNRLEASDTRLPRPGVRHFPVFYEGPLEIEEIIIGEAIGLDAQSSNVAPAETEPTRAATLAANDLRQPQQLPARSTGLGRNRLLTAPALIGLGAALAYAGYHLASRDNLATSITGVSLATPAKVQPEAGNSPSLRPAPDATNSNTSTGISESIETEFLHLTWVDRVSTSNHERILALIGILDGRLSEPDYRAALERYAERLLEINDADQLERLVLSLGGAIGRHPDWRDLLARLENRVIDLSKLVTAVRKPEEIPRNNSQATDLTAISIPLQGDAGL